MRHQTTLTQPLLIALATITLLLCVLSLRAGQPLLMSHEPYEHLSGGPLGIPTTYTHLIKVSAAASSPLIASLGIPILLGAISAILFASLLLRLGIDKRRTLIATGLLILTPQFIRTSLISSDLSLILALQLASANLLLAKNTTARTVAAITSAISGTFGATHLLAITGFAIATHHRDTKTLLRYVVTTMVIVAILTIFTNPITPSPHLSNPISDLGGDGITIFCAALAILGGFSLLGERPGIAAVLFAGSGIALAWQDTYMYASLICAIAAAHAIALMLQSHWQTPTLKQYTILIIACGIIFGTCSYALRLSETEPTNDMILALTTLRIHADETSVVLADPTDAPYIRSITGFLVHQDNSLLDIGTISQATEALHTAQVTHIYLSPHAKQRYAFPAQGLLLPLQDQRTFESIHQNHEYSIWELRDPHTP